MADVAAQFTGSVPENYDRYLGPRIFEDYAVDLTSRVVALEPDAVLELAAGTGIVTRKLRTALPDACQLIASDLNLPMLEVARTRFDNDEPIEFAEINACEIGLPDACVDVVACQFGVMFFPDKAESYREVLRVLKPGGSYLLNAWDSWSENPFAQIAQDTVEQFFPNDPPGFYKVPFGYHDAETIRQDVLSAGFESVTVEHVPIRSAIPSASDFATGLIQGNPLQEEIAMRGGDADAVHAAMTKAIAQKLGSEMPLQALFVHASKK
jgi:ubiquinone/menaquinone biosynthesis C-methylase UbiE